MIEVSASEFEKLRDLRDGKTWRELLLPPLGIETKRQAPGPGRKPKEG